MSEENNDGAACKAFFSKHKIDLATLARDTVEEGYSPEDFVLLCIDATDPAWKIVVDHLIRAFDVGYKEDDPNVVLGAMLAEDVIDVFTQLIPSITAQIAAAQFPAGTIRIITVHGTNVGLFNEELEDTVHTLN